MRDEPAPATTLPPRQHPAGGRPAGQPDGPGSGPRGPRPELVTARSGDETLRLLLQKDFAVILLDVQMQGLDGFATARSSAAASVPATPPSSSSPPTRPPISPSIGPTSWGRSITWSNRCCRPSCGRRWPSSSICSEDGTAAAAGAAPISTRGSTKRNAAAARASGVPPPRRVPRGRHGQHGRGPLRHGRRRAVDLHEPGRRTPARLDGRGTAGPRIHDYIPPAAGRLALPPDECAILRVQKSEDR